MMSIIGAFDWRFRKDKDMPRSTHTIITLGLVALTLAGTALATTSSAEAHNNFGSGLAAGIAGTLIGGALVAGAERHPVYDIPAYVAPGYVPNYPVAVQAYPSCHVVWRQNAWGDMYRARVCD